MYYAAYANHSAQGIAQDSHASPTCRGAAVDANAAPAYHPEHAARFLEGAAVRIAAAAPRRWAGDMQALELLVDAHELGLRVAWPIGMHHAEAVRLLALQPEATVGLLARARAVAPGGNGDTAAGSRSPSDWV